MIIKPELFRHKKVKSLQSTRIGGTSKKPYNDMNMGVFGQDTNAAHNVEIFSKINNLPHSLKFLNQQHTNKVIELIKEPNEQGEIIADACFTRAPKVICSVLSADCLPVLIADKYATVVAAVHCGWKGLYSDILKKTIQKIEVNNSDLQCWLGPCISYKPYRVDEDFRNKFVKKQAQFAHCFYRDKKRNWHADLKKIAVTQLESLGVKEIAQSPYCSHDNKNLFFSYRRDQETGRMASIIWLE
ncbi:MAG: peptidoglycan editing factor PgeF [Marinicellaceae bacterium]